MCRNTNLEDNYRSYVILNKHATAIEGKITNTDPCRLSIYFGTEDMALASCLKHFIKFETFSSTIEMIKELFTKHELFNFDDLIHNFDKNNQLHLIVGSVIAQICLYKTLMDLKAKVNNIYSTGIGLLTSYYAKRILQLEDVCLMAYIYAKRFSNDRNDDGIKKKYTNRFFNELLASLSLKTSNGLNLQSNDHVVCYGNVAVKTNNWQQFPTSMGNFTLEFLHHLGK